MGPGIGAAVAAVVQDLRDAGVSASADPAQVNPPGVYVTGDSAVPINLAGGWEPRVAVHLVVPATEPHAAWDLLDQLAADVQQLVEPDPDPPLEPVTLVLPGSGAGLPAYRYLHTRYTT